LNFLDHVGDREGLAGAGDAEQRLVRQARLDAVHERGDGGRLVACRRIVGLEVEGLRLVHLKLHCIARSLPVP
jgi:hypothetical protein